MGISTQTVWRSAWVQSMQTMWRPAWVQSTGAWSIAVCWSVGGFKKMFVCSSYLDLVQVCRERCVRARRRPWCCSARLDNCCNKRKNHLLRAFQPSGKPVFNYFYSYPLVKHRKIHARTHICARNICRKHFISPAHPLVALTRINKMKFQNRGRSKFHHQ